MKKIVFVAIFLAGQSLMASADYNKCTDAWHNVFVKGEIQGKEIVHNSAVGILASSSAYSGVKVSSAVKGATKLALTVKLGLAAGALGTAIALSNEEAWVIVDKIYKESLVGAGSLISLIGDTASEAGENYAPSDIADSIANSAFDPHDSRTAQFLCNEENRPKLLGTFIESGLRSIID